MTFLRKRMIEDLSLAGLSENTKTAYVHAVKDLAKTFKRSPDRITEEELRYYFLDLINKRKLAKRTILQKFYAIRFFYQKTLGRKIVIFEILKLREDKKLPGILSKDEVHKILSHVRSCRLKAVLVLIYSCGLRISEATKLKVCDIDGNRFLLTARNTKGKRDRQVPIPKNTLEVLRSHWKNTKIKSEYLFPGLRGSITVSTEAVQYAFREALKQSGIIKKATVHTLRHSYATHLLDSGINLKMIQQLLGHKSIKTTLIYVHLTTACLNAVREELDSMTSEF